MFRLQLYHVLYVLPQLCWFVFVVCPHSTCLNIRHDLALRFRRYWMRACTHCWLSSSDVAERFTHTHVCTRIQWVSECVCHQIPAAKLILRQGLFLLPPAMFHQSNPAYLLVSFFRSFFPCAEYGKVFLHGVWCAWWLCSIWVKPLVHFAPIAAPSVAHMISGSKPQADIFCVWCFADPLIIQRVRLKKDRCLFANITSSSMPHMLYLQCPASWYNLRPLVLFTSEKLVWLLLKCINYLGLHSYFIVEFSVFPHFV